MYESQNPHRKKIQEECRAACHPIRTTGDANPVVGTIQKAENTIYREELIARFYKKGKNVDEILELIAPRLFTDSMGNPKTSERDLLTLARMRSLVESTIAEIQST